MLPEKGKKHLSKCAIKYSLNVKNQKLQTLFFEIARAYNDPEKILNEYASFTLKNASITLKSHPLHSSLSKLYNPKYALSKDLHKEMVDKILQGKGASYINWIVSTKNAKQSLVQIITELPDCFYENAEKIKYSTAILEKLAHQFFISNDYCGKNYRVSILQEIREDLKKSSKPPSDIYLNNLTGFLFALNELNKGYSLGLKNELDKLQQVIDSYPMD